LQFANHKNLNVIKNNYEKDNSSPTIRVHSSFWPVEAAYCETPT